MADHDERRVALVTGGGSGIGKATAAAFAGSGFAVVVADVALAAAEETVGEILRSGGVATAVEADVARDDDARHAVEVAVAEYGRLDAAHNNAGVRQERMPIAELPPAEWERVLSINLTGVFYCLRHELNVMLKQGSGAIVNTCSTLGLVAGPSVGAYTAAKHGVAGLTRAAALECATNGVRVNAVCPGYVRTAMAGAAGPELRDQIVASHPVGRMAEPEEVAAAVVWLCSEQASFVTGTLLTVDGGYTAR
jgi:NAD(P)-dependent dehydrogenase (short-subunit alcohol dehydrogenase family)